MQKKANTGLQPDFTSFAHDDAPVFGTVEKVQVSGRLSQAGEWDEEMLKQSADWIERPKVAVVPRDVQGFYAELRKEMKTNTGRTSLLAIRHGFSSVEREVRFHLHRWKNVCTSSQV